MQQFCNDAPTSETFQSYGCVFSYFCCKQVFLTLIHFFNLWKSEDLLLLDKLKNRLDSGEQKLVQFSLKKIFWLRSWEINKDLLCFYQVQGLFFSWSSSPAWSVQMFGVTSEYKWSLCAIHLNIEAAEMEEEFWHFLVEDSAVAKVITWWDTDCKIQIKRILLTSVRVYIYIFIPYFCLKYISQYLEALWKHSF